MAEVLAGFAVNTETKNEASQQAISEEMIAEQAEALPLLDFEVLRDALGQQVETMQRQFKVKHRHLLQWAHRHGYTIQFLGANTGRMLMAGGLMVSLLTSAPQALAGIPRPEVTAHQQQLTKDEQVRAQQLQTVHEAAVRQAQAQQQLMVQLRDLSAAHQLVADPDLVNRSATALTALTGVKTTSILEGYELNTNIGRIGAEQHLKRYPGDALDGHNNKASGMAPGLGAYGYFASSKSTLTAEAIVREQYYVAIQTFKSPQWKGNVQAAYNWFKYRKVLVYSPVTGQAVVADVGDAGPGLSTGKAYGGSPEVMAALQAHDGSGTPPVLMLFVDDPTNQVPLGPVSFKSSPFELAPVEGGIR